MRKWLFDFSGFETKVPMTIWQLMLFGISFGMLAIGVFVIGEHISPSKYDSVGDVIFASFLIIVGIGLYVFSIWSNRHNFKKPHKELLTD